MNKKYCIGILLRTLLVCTVLTQPLAASRALDVLTTKYTQSKLGLRTQRVAGVTEYFSKLYALILESKMAANPQHTLESRYNGFQGMAAVSRAVSNIVTVERSKPEYWMGALDPVLLINAMPKERYAKHKEVRVLLLTLSAILQCIGNKKAWHVITERCIHLTETLLTYGWSKSEVKWSVVIQIVALATILYRSDQYQAAIGAEARVREEQTARREAERARWAHLSGLRAEQARAAGVDVWTFQVPADYDAILFQGLTMTDAANVPRQHVVETERTDTVTDIQIGEQREVIRTTEAAMTCHACRDSFDEEPSEIVSYRCQHGEGVAHYAHRACLEGWCRSRGQLVCETCRIPMGTNPEAVDITVPRNSAITSLGGRDLQLQEYQPVYNEALEFTGERGRLLLMRMNGIYPTRLSENFFEDGGRLRVFQTGYRGRAAIFCLPAETPALGESRTFNYDEAPAFLRSLGESVDTINELFHSGASQRELLVSNDRANRALSLVVRSTLPGEVSGE